MHRLIENASLLTLLVVVGLRPLVSESHDSAGQAITAALETVADPSPLRTIIFDVAMLVASCGVLMARAIGPARKFRPTGLEAGALLLLAAMVVSSIVAGQKRLAINASIDWICLPVLAIALTQLLDRPWRRHLLLAVVLASACAMAMRCVDQRMTMEDTVERYAQLKADGFWARQGVEIDSPKVAMFEQRLHSREVDGGFGHSNLAGSYLMLCAIAGAGAVLAGVKRSGAPIDSLRSIAGFAAIALILAALFLTGSRGAILSTVIAVTLWLLVYVFRRRIDAHRPRVWLLGWAAAACGVFALVGHGMYHGSLPGSSLNFRWQYWTASAQLIADHPLGVGGGNFGRHYTRYKTIESPEEVANPHNLFVHAAAEWGIAGLAGMLLMLVGCSIAVTRPVSEPGCPQPGPPSEPGCPQPVLWSVALIVLIFGIRIPLIDVNNPAYTYYDTVTTALAWGVGFVVFWVSRSGASDKMAGIGLAAVPIALFGFVLHDMINFAAFVPGVGTTCFALIALAVSTRTPDGREKPVASKRYAFAAIFAALAVTIAVVGFVAFPMGGISERRLDQARHAREANVSDPAIERHPAYRAYQRAARSDSLDPTPLVELARWLAGSVWPESARLRALDLAIASLEEAKTRDPHNGGLDRLSARILLRRAAGGGDENHYHRAVESARRALASYPSDPRTMILLADCQLAGRQALGDHALLSEAIEHLEEAVRLDAKRPNWDLEVRRLSDRERADIQTRIDRARAILDARGP